MDSTRPNLKRACAAITAILVVLLQVPVWAENSEIPVSTDFYAGARLQSGGSAGSVGEKSGGSAGSSVGEKSGVSADSSAGERAGSSADRSAFAGSGTTESVVAIAAVPPITQASEINRITARAVDKQLELLQMSTNLKLQTAPLNQWRERRWFSYAFSNQVLTAIGSYINGCTRLQYRNNTAKAPKNLFVNSSWLRVIAYAIILAGCAGEAANDLRIQWHEKKIGLDVKSYLSHARESLAAIDELIRQRAKLVEAEPDPEVKQALMKETQILQQIRNCCADDLEEAYIRARSVRAARFFQYEYVGASNILGGAGTLSNTIVTIQDKIPKYLWPGGVGDSVTGPMNAVAPELIRRAGLHAARKAGHPLTSEISFDARDAIVNKFDSDLQNFCNLPACQKNLEIAHHVSTYEVQGKVLAQHFSMRPQVPKGTVGRVVGDFGAFAGGITKCANGIETLVGAYQYPKKVEKRFETFGGGGIAYGVGMTIAAEETLRREVISEVRWHKLPKHKRLRSVLQEQMVVLNKARDGLQSEAGL